MTINPFVARFRSFLLGKMHGLLDLKDLKEKLTIVVKTSKF